MLEWSRRERKGATGDEVVAATDNTPATAPRVIEVQICSLSILCIVTAALSFLFFPALAAIPLGIFALRRIDQSNGALSGRHLAIAGLCIATTALAFWLALFAVGWIALSIVKWFFGLIF